MKGIMQGSSTVIEFVFDQIHWDSPWIKRGIGPVKLMQQVKIADSFLQSLSNQFHIIVLSFPS